MFKNLEGFKKVKEDKDAVVMQHPKGHTIVVALRSLPAIHRKQLMKLPLHECSGGEIKMAEGGAVSEYSPEEKKQFVQQNNDSYRDYTPEVKKQAADQVNNAYSSYSPPKKRQYYADGTGDVEPPDAQAPSANASQGNVPQEMPEQHGASGSWDGGELPKEAPASMPLAPGAEQRIQTQPNPGVPGMQAINPQSIYGLEAKGIQEKAQAEQGLARSDVNIEAQRQQQIKDEAESWDNRQKELVNHIQSTLQDIENPKNYINPSHYMESKSTPQKVSTAIGLFLGGLGSAFTHQGNPAMDFLNKQIERDVEAQKTNQNNKLNIYNGYLAQYHNAASAEAMTKATQLSIYDSKIRQAAAQAGTPEAQARANMATAQIQQQIFPLVQRANFLQQSAAIDQRAKGNGQLSQLPPEKLVQYSGAPQQDQMKMLEEIKDRQNINNIRTPALKAFDDAAKEVRPLTGGVHTSMTSFVPGMESPAQKSWQGLVNTTIKETEGTARAAAFDSVKKNFLPQFGDSDHNIQIKREGFLNYLKSKEAAPVSNAYGLNLNNYQTTTSAPAPKQYAPGQILYLKGSPVRIINDRGDYEPVK